MHRTNIHGRVSSEYDEDLYCCVPAALSVIDLLPFLYLVRPTSVHSPVNFDSQNNQTQNRSQTWSQLFANCSYRQNSRGNYSGVCHAVFESVSIFFLTVAFILGLALLLFNIAIVFRKLTRTELMIRTTMHIIYAFILFTTALTYTLTRHSCSNCREFIFFCIIPIPTTLCMAYNWHDCSDCNEIVEDPHQQQRRRRSPESESFQLELERFAAGRFPFNSGRTVSSQPSSSIPRRPLENDDADLQLENEFNDWLEAQQQRQNQ